MISRLLIYVADFILFTFTGEAVQTFGLHYCLLAQLEDTWLQENGTQFPFLSFVLDNDAAMV